MHWLPAAVHHLGDFSKVGNFLSIFKLAMASLIKSLGENVKMLVTNPKDEKKAEAEGGDDNEDNDDDNDPYDDDDAR